MAVDQNTLTDDQTAVYDRQLRVWGVEVQRKLTAAKVLIVGFGQLAAEVAKNITLAGVGHVTLLDDTPAAQHKGRNFLITAAATEQQTVAEAAAKTLQAMNPLVKVSAAPGSSSSSSIPTDRIQQQQLVIAVGLGLRSVDHLDDLCRKSKVGFMAAAAAGPGGWFFVDLGEHEYVPKDGGSGQLSVLSYPSFRAALTPPPGPLPNNIHPMYLTLTALVATEKAKSTDLTRHQNFTAEDLPAALDHLRKIAGAHPNITTAEQLMTSVLTRTAEFAPVCAILGGLIATNVIMAVSASDTPLNNMLYYTLLDGRAIVETQPVVAAVGVNGTTKTAAAVTQQKQPTEDTIELD